MFGEGGRQERRKEEGKGKTHPKAGVQSARGPACTLRCREQLWRLERAKARPGRCEPPEPEGAQTAESDKRD